MAECLNTIEESYKTDGKIDMDSDEIFNRSNS